MEQVASVGESQAIEEQETTFPVDALPEPMREFVAQSAEALSAAPDLVALPALVAAGAAIGNSTRIKLKDDYTESAALYGAVVAGSGCMKSPAQDKAVASVIEHENSEARTWTSDCTVERLAELLTQNPRGIAVIRDEFAGFVKSLNQYKGGKGADREFYLSGWSGSPWRGDRKNGTDLYIPHPFIALVGGIPPDILSDIGARTTHGDGFLERMLFAYPEPTPVQWSEQVVHPDAKSRYEQMFNGLYALPYQTSPTCLELNDSAREYFTSWYDSHCQQAHEAHLSSFLHGTRAKLRGYCARLALIHACCCDPQVKSIDSKSVAAAAALIEYFEAQAIKVDSLLASHLRDQVARCKGWIRVQLSGCRGVRRRDLQRSSYHPTQVFNRALDDMLTLGDVVIDGSQVSLART